MILTALIIMIILIILYIWIGLYFFNIALNPHVSKRYILHSLTSDEDRQDKTGDKDAKDEEWLKQLSKQVNIVTQDKLTLYGYEIKNPMQHSDIWVILVHGYMGKASEMVTYAKEFVNMGYNALLLDLRAHGKSEGKYIGMGWPDRKDVLQWIDTLREKEPDCKIILYGISMGAATVMMTSGEDTIPNNVKVCIEDCGYTCVWDEFKSLVSSINTVLARVILSSSNMIAKIKLGYGFKKASCIEQIKKNKIPMLFIHGDKDKFVPFSMQQDLYNVANCPKQDLVIEGAHHAESAKVNSELYWNTIDGFIKKYM